MCTEFIFLFPEVCAAEGRNTDLLKCSNTDLYSGQTCCEELAQSQTASTAWILRCSSNMLRYRQTHCHHQHCLFTVCWNKLAAFNKSQIMNISKFRNIMFNSICVFCSFGNLIQTSENLFGKWKWCTGGCLLTNLTSPERQCFCLLKVNTRKYFTSFASG